VERVAILGSGGVGKSELARALASETGLPVVHLDPATVFTDELQSYTGLDRDYDHRPVNHAIQYVDSDLHTNHIQNFLEPLETRSRRTPTSAFSRSACSGIWTSASSRSTSAS